MEIGKSGTPLLGCEARIKPSRKKRKCLVRKGRKGLASRGIGTGTTSVVPLNARSEDQAQGKMAISERRTRVRRIRKGNGRTVNTISFEKR